MGTATCGSDEYPSRDECLAMLRKCHNNRENIDQWNEYRRDNSDWAPPLSDKQHPADLRSLTLCYSVSGSKTHVGVDLSGARLHRADLSNTRLWGADLCDAYLRDANLSDVNLSDGTLRGADLTYANCSRIDLSRADITDVDFQRTNLSDADVTDVKYSRRKMCGKYKGVRAATCHGDAVFKRDAQDQDFIDTIESRINPDSPRARRLLFRLWAFIDFGRSLGRVALTASLVAVLFGALYWLDWYLGPVLLEFDKGADSPLSPFYYSIVTYTTLGFGDITPMHWLGEIVVMIEVVFGYVTLGLLLAVLANTVARRS